MWLIRHCCYGYCWTEPTRTFPFPTRCSNTRYVYLLRGSQFFLLSTLISTFSQSPPHPTYHSSSLLQIENLPTLLIQIMSSDESSPLLPQAETQQLPTVPHEHPIFLRVCHSQWSFLGGKTLLTSRLALTAYTAVVWIYTLVRDIKDNEEDGKLFPFYAGNISLTMQMVYYIISSVSEN